MAKIVNNELYLELKEVFEYLHMSRTTFYRDTSQRLRKYTFDGRSKPWFKREEVIALAEGRLEKRPPIVISGILRDWTSHVRSLGLQIDTQNCTIEIGVPLAPEVCTWLGIPEQTAFVKRKRISFIEKVPICVWSTSYPLVQVSSFLDEIKHNNDFDVVKALKESRGITIKQAKDRYKARPATQYEQEILQLKRDEPILQLERAAYSELHRLILYSNMSLLGSWFQPEIPYDVDIW